MHHINEENHQTNLIYTAAKNGKLHLLFKHTFLKGGGECINMQTKTKLGKYNQIWVVVLYTRADKAWSKDDFSNPCRLTWFKTDKKNAQKVGRHPRCSDTPRMNTITAINRLFSDVPHQ